MQEKCSCSRFRIFFVYIGSLLQEWDCLKKKVGESKYRQHLAPGKYRMVRVGKNVLYRSSSAASSFLRRQVIETSHDFGLFKFKIKQIISIAFRLKISKSEGTGDLVLFSQAGDVKIFDFRNRLVFTFVANCKRYNRLEFVTNVFDSFFHIPIKCFVDKRRMVVEKYVDVPISDVETPHKHITALKCYLNGFKKYLQHADNNGKVSRIKTLALWNSFSSSLKQEPVMQQLHSTLAKNGQKEWASVMCHGDFNQRNVLLSDKCYIIDWEFSDEYIFFYDFYNYIVWATKKRE